MFSHIAIILETLREIQSGTFHESLPEEIRTILQETAVNPSNHGLKPNEINDSFIEYAFLHDLSKPDCLTLTLENGDKQEVIWEEWIEIDKLGKPFSVQTEAGKTVVTSISYYQASHGPAGQHGNKAVALLESSLTSVTPEIITAIANHEIAYQFGKISTAAYEKHFIEPGFGKAEQDFILLASYIDTMASWKPEGKPDLTNFNCLVQSRLNHELVQQFYQDNPADKIRISDNDLQALKKRNALISLQDIVDINKYIDYDFKAIEGRLQSQASQKDVIGNITEKDVTVIIEILKTNPEELGKQFGPKMRFISKLLKG